MNYNGFGAAGHANLNMVNSTVSSNTSAGQVGGIYNDGDASKVSLNFCTISGNSAASISGGLYQGLNGTLEIKNSVIANNTATQGPDIFGPITTLDYNHIENVAGGEFVPLPHDVTGIDPQLGPLALTCGRTMSHYPGPDSPIRNSIPHGANGCGTSVFTDQCGVHRNNACEKGSVEIFFHPSPTPTASATATPILTPTPTATPTLTPTATPTATPPPPTPIGSTTPPFFTVTVGTNPQGLMFSVDGVTYSTAAKLYLECRNYSSIINSIAPGRC